MLRQQVFDFGPRDHFTALHGGHPFAVAVATKSASGEFAQRLYGHDDALAMLLNLAVCDDWATYLSQSGFAAAGGRRTVHQVRALTSLWIDADYYKLPALAGLSPEQLLDAALARFPWMPAPTLLVESGRGAYFVWSFDKPLHRDRLPEWQMVQDALVATLEPFGADAAARDAARILRVAGSFHLVAGDRVRARRVGDAVAFDTMRQLVVHHGVDVLERRRAAVLRPAHLVGIDGDIGPRKRTGTGLHPYRLAHDRMADYRRLAELRGIPLRDCRHRLLYAYAQAAAWFCGSVAQLRDEIDGFADAHFAGGEQYRSNRVQTVVNRFLDDDCGKLVRLKPEANAGRYRFTNGYILRLLDVTAAEQRQLGTIISSEEKRRRETEKRRASGMMSRQQYVDRAAQRRQEARRLRSEGLAVPDIAECLGVSVRGVYAALQG
jgi:hypothetical protein